MRKKKVSSTWLLLIAGAGLFSVVIFFLSFNLLPAQGFYAKLISPPNASAKTTQTTTAKPAKSAPKTAVKKPIATGAPVNLKIPKINVDAVLESVGLTPQGAVAVPKGPVNAAWFNLGPHPGDIGNAVITGHYGIWKSGTPTVFNNLYKLRRGDKIYIKDDRGVTTTFIVRESRSYDPKTEATDVFISSDGKSHLNLITCGGAWNKVAKSYPKRLVVFADKE